MLHQPGCSSGTESGGRLCLTTRGRQLQARGHHGWAPQRARSEQTVRARNLYSRWRQHLRYHALITDVFATRTVRVRRGLTAAGHGGWGQVREWLRGQTDIGWRLLGDVTQMNPREVFVRLLSGRRRPNRCAADDVSVWLVQEALARRARGGAP